MQELIKYIVQAMVDHPEQVEVAIIEGTRTSVFEVRVAQEDMGKVIGKQGRNARAIRTMISAVSAKTKKHAFLEIVE